MCASDSKLRDRSEDSAAEGESMVKVLNRTDGEKLGSKERGFRQSNLVVFEGLAPDTSRGIGNQFQLGPLLLFGE